MDKVKFKFTKEVRSYRTGEVAIIDRSLAERWEPKRGHIVGEIGPSATKPAGPSETKPEGPSEQKELDDLPEESPGPDEGYEPTGEWRTVSKNGGWFDVVDPSGVVMDTVRGESAAEKVKDELAG